MEKHKIMLICHILDPFGKSKKGRITHIFRFGTVEKHFRCMATPKKCLHFYELMLKPDRVHLLKSFDISVVAALIHANASMVSMIIKYSPQTDEVISGSFDESKCGSLATLFFLHSPIYCPCWCHSTGKIISVSVNAELMRVCL